MTVRRGEDWGAPGALGAGAPAVADDDAAAAGLADWRATGRADPFEVGLLGGDLHRTLGGPRHDVADLRSGRGVRHPCDAVLVEAHGPDGPFGGLAVAHVAAVRGRRLFARRTVVVMNAAFRGGLDLGPRAHPGDGLLDVTDGAVPRREVRTALRRAATGSHVPHPGLTERRGPDFEFEADPGSTWDLELDGIRRGRADRFRVTCLPDALVVVS